MTRCATAFPSRTSVCVALFVTLFAVAAAVPGYAQTCAAGSGVKVTVHPTDDVQSIVNSTVCGSTFIFAPGTYANLTIFPIDETTNPIDGDTFKGQDTRTSKTPSILYGGTVVSNFTLQSTYWVGNVVTTPAPASGPNYKCDTKHPGCLLPEDLFFDGNPYLRQTSKAAVGAGSWYLDTSTGNVYLKDNPTGHKIEISTTHFAIYASNVANVTISNLIVDKYSAPGGFGAISGVDPTGASVTPTFNWKITNVEVRNCHGAGVELGNHMAVTTSFLHNNGEYGVGGTGNNISFSHNEVSYNNYAGFLPEVGAGTKFSNVTGLTVTYNNVHDNLGAGLTDDNGSTSITYSFNTLQNNLIAGILHEIGYSASIHDNTSTNDGYDSRGTGFFYGAGISIANSSNTKVYNNTLTNDQNGIIEQAVLRTDCVTACPLKNVTVYNNTIVQSHTVKPGTYAAGIVMGAGDTQGLVIYTGAGNSFGYNPVTKTSSPNIYTLTPSSDVFFVWDQSSKANVGITYSQWLTDGEN
jgi:parallel beta helix pectate lyase-like protein